MIYYEEDLSRAYETCPLCNGEGIDPWEYEICVYCHGEGKVSRGNTPIWIGS